MKYELIKSDTYALGIKALKPATPMTFKQVIQARLEDNSLFDNWVDTCTAVVGKKTGKFKIITKCDQLINIDKDFNESYINCDYSKVEGKEISIKNDKYNEQLTKKEALNHKGWITLLENDTELLKKYVDYVFKDRTRAMCFWINNKKNTLRAVFVNSLDFSSVAYGNVNLSNLGRFLRVVAPVVEKSNIIQLSKRTETEQVAYLVGKYFTKEITLKYLKLQINAIEEPISSETNTSRG